MAIHDSRSDRAYYLVNYLVLGIFCALVLYPLIYVLSASFSDATAIANNEVYLWPVGFSTQAYQAIWASPRLLIGFGNSVLYTVTAALIGTTLTVLAGYVASREELPFRRVIVVFFLLPTLISAGIVPLYIVIKQMDLLDTRWAIILPTAMSMFQVIITRTFYQINVPKELVEAGRVDGANDFSMFFRIALPLSKPIIAVNLLFYGLAQWNDWFNAFLYTSNPDLSPLQFVLQQLLAESSVSPSMMGSGDVAAILAKKELFDKLKYAMIVVAMVPPLIAYPFVQKHFVKGALIGAVK
ncbi:ABC-type glycerol-3-phosphate transport system permease component [Friedmanniella endophytica]|uniref:ABC-type glycerol-3-phosphate transport system permease component n=1 Tax=Microlunatus kandeliicorticis TaxID=1759536 RepID=A0A7W3IUS9_9ACTN|nr:carbohydrate ABC transporter permease [Microlunatus kandeliicorticis]MBA8795647.1 ABC-type glycerol-3-phosphate transport system permease component [Microlunatus kandeliicorticis]